MSELTGQEEATLTSSTGGPTTDPEEEIEKLRATNTELRSKLERWRDQSKLGIEQHRNRIKELSAKLSASSQQIYQMEKFISQVLTYFYGSSTAMFSSLATHGKTVEMVEVSAVKASWSRLVRSKESLLQECTRAHQQKMEAKEEELYHFKEQLRVAEEELLEMTLKVDQLESKVKRLSSQETLRESAATHEAVSLAVNAAQENFASELMSVRMQYENEKNELRMLHEVEMIRMQEEMEHRVHAARVEAEARSRHLSATASTAGFHHRTSNANEEDASYIALFKEHEEMEKQARDLQRENKQLREEIGRQREIAERRTSSSGTSRQGTESSPMSSSGLPASLSDAHSLLISLRGREKTLQSELCDLQLQLGALREHPPLPEGALSAEQVKYIKTLFMKLFTATDKGRMMDSLAPVIEKVLDFSASDPLHVPR